MQKKKKSSAKRKRKLAVPDKGLENTMLALHEQLIELRHKITVLEIKLGQKQDKIQHIPFSQPIITTTSYYCTDGKPHEYPNPWFATIPPPCKKCGKVDDSHTIICNTL